VEVRRRVEDKTERSQAEVEVETETEAEAEKADGEQKLEILETLMRSFEKEEV
jgi:hypothetical protein